MGPALVLFAEPGKGFNMDRFNHIGNVVRGPMMHAFGNGRAPSADDWEIWRLKMAAQMGV